MRLLLTWLKEQKHLQQLKDSAHYLSKGHLYLTRDQSVFSAVTAPVISSFTKQTMKETLRSGLLFL